MHLEDKIIQPVKSFCFDQNWKKCLLIVLKGRFSSSMRALCQVEGRESRLGQSMANSCYRHLRQQQQPPIDRLAKRPEAQLRQTERRNKHATQAGSHLHDFQRINRPQHKILHLSNYPETMSSRSTTTEWNKVLRLFFYPPTHED